MKKGNLTIMSIMLIVVSSAILFLIANGNKSDKSLKIKATPSETQLDDIEFSIDCGCNLVKDYEQGNERSYSCKYFEGETMFSVRVTFTDFFQAIGLNEINKSHINVSQEEYNLVEMIQQSFLDGIYRDVVTSAVHSKKTEFLNSPALEYDEIINALDLEMLGRTFIFFYGKYQITINLISNAERENFEERFEKILGTINIGLPEDNWKEKRNIPGNYSVTFPGPAKTEVKQITSEQGLLTTYLEYYFPKNNDPNIGYITGYSDYPDVRLDDEQWVNEFFRLRSIGMIDNVHGKLLLEEIISYKGFPGRRWRYTWQNNTQISNVISYLVNHRLFFIQVNSLIENDFNYSMYRFLDSFSVLNLTEAEISNSSNIKAVPVKPKVESRESTAKTKDWPSYSVSGITVRVPNNWHQYPEGIITFSNGSQRIQDIRSNYNGVEVAVFSINKSVKLQGNFTAVDFSNDYFDEIKSMLPSAEKISQNSITVDGKDIVYLFFKMKDNIDRELINRQYTVIIDDYSYSLTFACLGSYYKYYEDEIDGIMSTVNFE